MKKLPNGFGTIYKLSGARRKPWIARKMIGKSPDFARQTMRVEYLTIGYFKTRAEALQALSEYNSNPSDPKRRSKTLAEVYEAWSKEHFKKVKVTKQYGAAFRVLSVISDRPIADLKLDDLQWAMTTSGKNAPVLRNVKSLLSMVFRYAAIHEIVPQTKADMIKYLDIGKENPNAITRTIFTPEERRRAREGTEPIDRITFFLICTGLRVSEFVNLRPEDVQNGMISIREAKTKAGIRTIPLPPGLSVPARMAVRTIEYQMRKKYNHAPHDCRHTFTTLAVEAGIDQRIIDAVVGHVQSGNLSLSVYTHITPEAMTDCMQKVLEIC